MSHHHSLLTDQGFAASHLTQRCSNRTSQALKRFTGKGRTAPHPSPQETNTSMPKKPDSASSITQNLSWEKAWLLAPLELSGTPPFPYNSFEPHQPNNQFPISNSLHHTSLYTQSTCISHPPLGAPEDRTPALSEQTCDQLQTLCSQ